MLTQALHRGLQASALAAVLATPLAAEAAPQGSDLGLVDQMAAQLAARSDVFAATTASLTVVPVNMAGSCPRSFMLQIDLGAQSPGTLSYRIETLDGRVSQVFKARTGALEDGLFGARVAVADGLLGAFLVVDDEQDGDAGIARPGHLGRLAVVADDVALRAKGSGFCHVHCGDPQVAEGTSRGYVCRGSSVSWWFAIQWLAMSIRLANQTPGNDLAYSMKL